MRGWIAAVAAVTIAGCIAPVSTGSPEPATTAGKGEMTARGRIELPSLNLISDERGRELREEGLLAPVAGVEGSYGVADRIDLEGGIEMPLYFLVVPIPNAIWAGARVQLVDSGSLAVAAAARGGGLALGKVEGDVETDEEARARFGFLSLSAEVGSGPARPGLTLRYGGYDVSTSGVDNVPEQFTASLASATLFVRIRSPHIDVAPYLNIARFDSPAVGGEVTWYGGGLSFALHGAGRQPASSGTARP